MALIGLTALGKVGSNLTNLLCFSQARLDTSNCGDVEVDDWLDLAQEVIYLASSAAASKSGEASEASQWETETDCEKREREQHELCAVAVIIWFALDEREAGELPTSRFIAWLRRIVAAPSTSMLKISDVYITMNRG
jgi:hypothetical protein